MLKSNKPFIGTIDLRTKPVVDKEILDAIALSESGDAEAITRRILSEKYPYIDWNTIDFNNLEQDNFSTKMNNCIGIVRLRKKSNKWPIKQYVMKCQKCSIDEQLFGYAIYITDRKSIKNNQVGCGCTKYTKWSKYQYIIRIQRQSIIDKILFIGFNGDFCGKNTKLNLYCNIRLHGKWNYTTVNNFLSQKEQSYGCPVCKKESQTIADDIHIEKFFSTGKYKDGTVFCRTHQKEHIWIWKYKCPICSYDEYVQNGVCTGIFEIPHSDLLKGKYRCRCSLVKWTQEQREYQINRELSKRLSKHKFIKWKDDFGYKNPYSKFIYYCEINEEYNEISINEFIDVGCGCSSCYNRNQKESYINLILDNDIPIAIKYGITVNHKKRVSTQNRYCIYDVKNFGKWEFDSPYLCKSAEDECKRTFTRVLEKREMKDGYTETTSVLNLENIIEIYENWGGIYIK
ncbi:hypothetical protein DIDNDMLP_00398 [Klebsiella phage KP13-7]|nr:hypothetical protein DIDNDMLP_00398 [Klebsiella phage KP13-7]